MHAGFLHFQALFQHYGLTAVFAVLLLENFGLPLPGEIALLYAGYQLRRSGAFGLPELVLVASCACIAGQTAGFWIGLHYTARLQRWLPPAQRERVEGYFRRHGPVTILFARFLGGIRIVVGPIAGLYRMPVRPFMIYNVCGAVLWAAVMGYAGSQLGAHGPRLESWLRRFNLLGLALALIIVLIAVYRMRRAPA